MNTLWSLQAIFEVLSRQNPWSYASTFSVFNVDILSSFAEGYQKNYPKINFSEKFNFKNLPVKNLENLILKLEKQITVYSNQLQANVKICCLALQNCLPVYGEIPKTKKALNQDWLLYNIKRDLLRGIFLVDGNLTGIDFTGEPQTRMTRAFLQNSNIYNSDLANCLLSGSHLEGTAMSLLQNTNLFDCKIDERTDAFCWTSADFFRPNSESDVDVKLVEQFCKRGDIISSNIHPSVQKALEILRTQ